MKKIISLILIGILISGIVGCGKTPDVPDNTNKSSDTIVNSTASSDSDDSASDNVVELIPGYSRYERFPGNIYINYKDNYGRYSVASGKVYCDSKKSLTAVMCSVPDGETFVLEDVPSLLCGRFADTAHAYAQGVIDGSELKMKDSEKVVVSGFESIKFTGTINNKYVDCFTYGYAFVINGYPCVVLGLVSSDEQEQELIDNVIKEVDTMVKTIRVEE